MLLAQRPAHLISRTMLAGPLRLLCHQALPDLSRVQALGVAPLLRFGLAARSLDRFRSAALAATALPVTARQVVGGNGQQVGLYGPVPPSRVDGAVKRRTGWQLADQADQAARVLVELIPQVEPVGGE